MAYYLSKVLKEMFYVLTGALVIFSCLELLWPRLIIAYINLNWLLIFWLIVGIVILLNRQTCERK